MRAAHIYTRHSRVHVCGYKREFRFIETSIRFAPCRTLARSLTSEKVDLIVEIARARQVRESEKEKERKVLYTVSGGEGERLVSGAKEECRESAMCVGICGRKRCLSRSVTYIGAFDFRKRADR